MHACDTLNIAVQSKQQPQYTGTGRKNVSILFIYTSLFELRCLLRGSATASLTQQVL